MLFEDDDDVDDVDIGCADGLTLDLMRSDLLLVCHVFVFYVPCIELYYCRLKKQYSAVYENPSHSYGVSLSIWDHTVLPATRHK